jgi:magnesium transporter
LGVSDSNIGIATGPKGKVMNIQAAMSNEFVMRYPARSARVVESLPIVDQMEELGELKIESLVTLLDFLSPTHAGEIFAALDLERKTRVLTLAPPRLAVVLLAQLDPSDEFERVISELPKSLRTDLQRQLSFPENSAGRLMDGVFISCHTDMTVEEALRSLRTSKAHRARSLFVVDEDNRLAGRVDLQDLALSEPNTQLKGILHPAEAMLTALDQREQIVDLLDQYRLDSLPVVDGVGKLMGVVRYGGLFKAIEEVAIAGMQKMVGNAEERALSTARFAVKKRLPWLHINLLTAFLAASVVGLFEDIISQFTALAILLPVVAGQSGNAGAQALAVTMRGLALREIGLREWKKVLNKEAVVGIVDGVVLAITCGAGVFLWSGSFGLTIVIAVAMILSMLMAGIAGAVVPIALTRAGQDPATASSIILTTVTDVAGFLSFLGTATLLSFML